MDLILHTETNHILMQILILEIALTGDNFIVGPNTAGREGYIFEQTFSNPIGTNSKGKPLYTLKVVIDEAGNVITAFPKK